MSAENPASRAHDMCLTLTSCDDSTVIRLAATEAEIRFLQRLSAAIDAEDRSNNGSLSGCQPRIEISDEPRGGWLDEDGDPRWDVMVPAEGKRSAPNAARVGTGSSTATT